ncbi:MULTISPECIES: RNA 2',3'-cyclic phosphodiesterase [Bacillus]|uniref:RNA 2',3'-cyclic phosphodiesterase n=1 Tax=Bacillus TaxID=1386 RepID=UPI0012FEA461|nr:MULTISPECIES: RNA 2',3'-cyclic phosphodiesterase [Bacillus]
MSLSLHYFVAVALPDELKKSLSIYMNELKKEIPFERWVHPQDLHITLAFLGKTNEEMLKKLHEELNNKKRQKEPFTITLQSLGTFGNKQSPRIFWCGVEKNEKLSDLRDQVFTSCGRVGYELETRPFHPHVTLARKWKSKSFEEERLNVYNQRKDTFICDKFVLYKTNLHSLPKYEVVETYHLQLE